MKQITRAWLNSASDDLDSIEQLLKKDHLTNVVAFHAQQAVEKTFKAVIEELEIGLIKTHDLTRLYQLVQPHTHITPHMDMLEQLNAVYTESQYPNEMGLLPHGKPTPKEASHFYIFANEIYTQIKSELERSTKR